MIFDANKANEIDIPRYDTCIIGAGAAGISLALKLERNGQRVALCEGGGLEVTEQSQDCYAGTVIGDEYFDLTYSRLRYFGGSTNHWGGMCRSFEDIDFDRGYLSEAFVWPIGRGDIEPYLEEACDILEIDPDFDDEVYSERHGIKKADFKFSPPVRFGEAYREKLSVSDHIDVYLNANLVDLWPESRAVRKARFKNFDGEDMTILAGNYVLAMGGIENSRQLLWQYDRHGESIFSGKLPLGRYWMEHPHYKIGEALVSNSVSANRYYSLTQQAQRTLGVMSCGLRVIDQGRTRTRKLIKELLCVAPTVGRRLAELADKELICDVEFRAAWEQTPHYGNRVALSNSGADRFGIPLTELYWKKHDMDRKTIEVTVHQFNTWLLENELGRIKLEEWFYRGEDYPSDGEIGGNHHMGGTRMANSAEYGVTDRDCRVFGTANLYVAGSSLFTTSGHNNPTLPIVQLALRLGDHLGRSR